MTKLWLTKKIRRLKLLRLEIKRDISSDPTELEYINEFYGQLYANTLDNLDKMKKKKTDFKK